MDRPQPSPQEDDDALIRYLPAVRKYFARRVGSWSEAEDLTQELASRVLERRDSPSIANLEGYLFQAAANLLKEKGRQETFRNAAQSINLPQDVLDGEDARTPERILIGRDAYQRMKDALFELPEVTQAVFVFGRFEGLKVREIAARLGIAVPTVEKHMKKAIDHLRASIS